MGAAVMLRDHFNVFMSDVAFRILALDPGVGKVDTPIEQRQVVLACPGLDLFRLAVRPPRAVGPAAVPPLEELLVLTFQFVVEDNAPDASIAGTEALLCAKISTIDLRVVRQLARFAQTRIERLARFIVALHAVGVENITTTASEDHHVT
jgi:hypothetical protein